MHKANGHHILPMEEDTDFHGDAHFLSNMETPMRAGAFDLTDEEKVLIIQKHFKAIMETLGLDLSDDSLSGTPQRVAKMYVMEKFKGLNQKNQPDISLFENKYQYNKLLIEKNINVQSTCEHHFLPIYGKAHVGYISSGKVIGLSKINRLVDYFARRPQVQERMTRQILQALQEALDTHDVIVVIDAKHMCVSSRGIQDHSSSTLTMDYSGTFINQAKRNEFLHFIQGDSGI